MRYLYFYLFFFDFFQLDGAMSMRSGNISSLPASISKIKTRREPSENPPKFPVGPTTESPGPILLSVAKTAVKLVVKSKLSKLIKRTENTSIARYETINTLIDLTVSCSTGRPPIITLWVLLGCAETLISLITVLKRIIITKN